jgi:hypothetical protein
VNNVAQCENVQSGTEIEHRSTEHRTVTVTVGDDASTPEAGQNADEHSMSTQR